MAVPKKKNITRKKELKTFNSMEAQRAHTHNLPQLRRADGCAQSLR